MADLITLKARLEAAETAEHEILTGNGVRRFIDQNGESVEYSMVNIKNLQQYISRLKQQIAALENTAARYRGPLTFSFGRRR